MTPTDEQLRSLLQHAAPSSEGVDFESVANQGRRFQRRRRVQLAAGVALVAVVAGSLAGVVTTSGKSGEATVSPKPSSASKVTYALTPVGLASSAALKPDADLLTRRLAAAGIAGKAQADSGGITLQVPASAASTVAYLTATGRIGFRIPSAVKPAPSAGVAKTGGCFSAPGPASGSPPPCITAQLAEAGCPKAGSIAAQELAVAPASYWIVACDTTGTIEYALAPERLGGDAVASAKATIQSGENGTSTGQWMVELNFTSAGQKAWSNLTDAVSRSPGCPASGGGPTAASPPASCQLAVVVDGIVQSAPVIQERIGGSAEIAGDFDEQSARALAAALGSGALPAPLSVGQPLDLSYSWNGGTFRYPVGWRLSTFNDVSSFTDLVAYVSNYPINDPCTHALGGTTCEPTNMARLGAGGVLIGWDIYGFPGYDIDKAPGTPTSIDGRPARIKVGPAAAGSACAVIGASEEVDVVVATTAHGAGSFWRMNGCAVDPSSLGTVIAVARSLQLSAPAHS